MKQPDKLFRDKLRGYDRPVSRDTWHKIAVNLDKKKSDKIWLKLAASVILVALCGIALWNLLDVPSKNLAHGSNKPLVEQPAKLNDSSNVETLPQISENVETPDVAPGKEKSQPHKNGVTTPKKKDKSTNKKENVLHPATPPVVEDHTRAPENFIAQTESVTPVLPVNNERSVTLIFNAEQVNEKFLNKNPIVQATPEEKKPSTLRKLLDKAYDLKHNQDPLGNLRQRKNEILALNFKNDKQRSENQ
jgi:hypothetical protein